VLGERLPPLGEGKVGEGFSQQGKELSATIGLETRQCKVGRGRREKKGRERLGLRENWDQEDVLLKFEFGQKIFVGGRKVH